MTSSQWLKDNPTHRFAWDGFSFQTPQDWNLSDYLFQRECSWVRMEDDNALRLEMEWTRSRKPIELERIQERFAGMAASITEAGAETAVVEALPEGWSAFLYSMPDGRHLLTAFRLVPGSDFFCFFKLHFESASRREPPRLIHLIASTFQLHEQGPIPWELFDVAFTLEREFRLIHTSFQAGRQMMIFEWRLRKLYLCFFSVADMILKDKSMDGASRAMEAWCADFLNGFRGIQGPTFSPGDQPGVIVSRRRWRYPLGHVEEIARWCFRYYAQCAHLVDKNQIVLWVFQYRTAGDLNVCAIREVLGITTPWPGLSE